MFYPVDDGGFAYPETSCYLFIRVSLISQLFCNFSLFFFCDFLSVFFTLDSKALIISFYPERIPVGVQIPSLAFISSLKGDGL